MTGPPPEMAGPGGPMAGPSGPQGGLPPELMQMMMAQGGPGGPSAGPMPPGGPSQGPPGYRPASDPALACGTCAAFQQGMCAQFGVPVQEFMMCEAWVPGQGGQPGPMGGDEIPPEDQVLL